VVLFDDVLHRLAVRRRRRNVAGGGRLAHNEGRALARLAQHPHLASASGTVDQDRIAVRRKTDVLGSNPLETRKKYTRVTVFAVDERKVGSVNAGEDKRRQVLSVRSSIFASVETKNGIQRKASGTEQNRAAQDIILPVPVNRSVEIALDFLRCSFFFRQQAVLEEEELMRKMTRMLLLDGFR